MTVTATPATRPAHVPDLAIYPEGTQLVPLARVRLPENNARKNLAVKALKDQIAVKGILEPLTVSPLGTAKDGEVVFEVIHGSRRWMAARQLGLAVLPICVIKPMTDIKKLRVQLINNSSRRQLSLVEEAHAIMDVLCGRLQLPQHEVTPLLHQLGHTERNSGTKVQSQHKDLILEVMSEAGRTLANYRSNMLKLLNYPTDVKQAFNAGHIGRSKLEVLGKVKGDEQRRYFLNQTIQDKLTKGQLLARMGNNGDPALAIQDKDFEELRQNVMFLFDEVRATNLWQNFYLLAEFKSQLLKWVKCGQNSAYAGPQST